MSYIGFTVAMNPAKFADRQEVQSAIHHAANVLLSKHGILAVYVALPHDLEDGSAAHMVASELGYEVIAFPQPAGHLWVGTADNQKGSVSMPVDGQWVPVKSSNVRAAMYLSGDLYLEFTSGSRYRYIGVPLDLFREFMIADSKGQFVHERLKKTFESRMIQPPKDQQITPEGDGLMLELQDGESIGDAVVRGQGELGSLNLQVAYVGLPVGESSSVTEQLEKLGFTVRSGIAPPGSVWLGVSGG